MEETEQIPAVEEPQGEKTDAEVQKEMAESIPREGSGEEHSEDKEYQP